MLQSTGLAIGNTENLQQKHHGQGGARLIQKSTRVARPNLRLLARDLVNTAWVRVCEFGAKDFTTLHDKTHSSRDRGRSEPSERYSYVMSRAMYAGKALLASDPETDLQGRLWQFFETCGAAFGLNNEQPLSSLAFDAPWLRDLSATLSQQWCWMHTVLSRQHSDFSRLQLMSWFSAMEFAARAERSVMKNPGLLQVLLAFALVPDMAEVTPPPIDRFELTNGHLLNARVARDDIECFYRSFGRHSESDLPR